MTDIDNLSSEELEAKEGHLRALLMVNGLLAKFVFPLRQIAEIITDDDEPIAYLSLRKWVDGQVLRLRPSTKFPGYKKPQFGHRDVCTFLLAKKLLRGFSGVPIPTAGVQTFLDRWTDDKFMPAIGYVERMKGRLILVPDRNDPSNLEVFFHQDLDAKFIAAVEVLSKAGITFVAICLKDIVDEVFERIFCWANDKNFSYRREEQREAWKRAFRSAGHLRDEVNSAKEALKS